MPRRKKTAVSRPCANCGKPFETTRELARFCPSIERDDKGRLKVAPCQLAFANRMKAEGAVLAPFIKAWIEGRGGGHSGSHKVVGPCMSEITSIARGFIDADKEAGRPSAIPYVESLLAEGLYIDRKVVRRKAAGSAE